MPAYRKSEGELRIELEEQIFAFRASLDGYDRGDLWEAKRIASSIYVLCFDGSGRTKSLLGMLGLLNGLKMHDTANSVIPNNIDVVMVVPPTHLLSLQMGPSGTHFIPTCQRKNWDPQSVKVGFQRWWNDPIFYPASKIVLSRKNVIFTARTQDGGSHVDDRIKNLDYRILKTVGQISVTAGGDYGSGPIGNAIWPIIRQIGWEVDQTLREISP